MTTHRIVLVLAATGLAVGCANVPRSRDTGNPDVSGETLAQQVCSNCHGVTGNSVSPNFPNLAAQQEAYLVAQLNGFKSKSREDPPGPEYMWGLSRNLTDKQIQEIATYFAAQPLSHQGIEGKPDRVAAGKAIFTDGIADKGVPPCGSCHGPEGRGNGNYPHIAGQHAHYVEKQLAVFQQTNARPEGTLMKTVTHNLSNDDIVNVAAYLQSMPNQ